MQQDESLITAKQICQKYAISNNSLYRYIKLGLMPPGRPAGLRAVRWRPQEVEDAFKRMRERRVAS